MSPAINREDAEMKALMDTYQTKVRGIHSKIKEDRVAGEAALRRLLPIAQRITGQGGRVARILLGQDGPVARKVAEVDARPSDALVLAVKAKRPVFVAKAVLDACDDMAETLARLRKQA